MQPYNSHQWLNIATAGIVSPKERESARQELSDHIEDHAEALMAAGLTCGQAQQQAVCAMGDPAEVGKRLRKAHQPILTRLLRVMRGVLITLICLFSLRAMICLLSRDPVVPLWLCGNPQKATVHAACFQLPPRDPHHREIVVSRRVIHPDTKMQVGDYTVTVHSAAVSQYGEGYGVDIVLDFTAASLLQDEPVFLEHLLLQSGEEVQEVYPYYQTNFRNLHHHYVLFHNDFTHDPQTVSLTYPLEECGFSLEIDLKGGWDYEKGR